jgi:hypothetical protein
MFLAKVTTSGLQLGFDLFRSPNAGSNFATALAIDANDNVYVTGYVLNTQGGSEFVTIKYAAAPKIENKPNGAMHLEFHTSPGQQYAIEATSDFFNWHHQHSRRQWADPVRRRQCARHSLSLLSRKAALNWFKRFRASSADVMPNHHI